MSRSFENNRDVVLQTTNVKNSLSFILDFLQGIKQEEPAAFHIANRAIDAVHRVDSCLDEIEAIRKCSIG